MGSLVTVDTSMPVGDNTREERIIREEVIREEVIREEVIREEVIREKR